MASRFGAKNLRAFPLVSVGQDIAWYGAMTSLTVFYVLCLVGCVLDAPAISSLSLLTLHGSNSSNDHVAIGFFGICIQASNNGDCRPSAGVDATSLMDSFNATLRGVSSRELQYMIDVSLKLQSKVLLSPLPGAGVVFIMSLVAWYLWWRLSSQSGSNSTLAPRILKAFWVLWVLCFALSLASALEMTVAIAAARFSMELATTAAPFSIADTRSATTLQWLIVAFLVLFALLAAQKQRTLAYGGGGGKSAHMLPIAMRNSFTPPPARFQPDGRESMDIY